MRAIAILLHIVFVANLLLLATGYIGLETCNDNNGLGFGLLTYFALQGLPFTGGVLLVYWIYKGLAKCDCF